MSRFSLPFEMEIGKSFFFYNEIVYESRAKLSTFHDGSRASLFIFREGDFLACLKIIISSIVMSTALLS